MRVIYVPGSEREWARYYGTQAAQHGAGFVGIPYQRGTGLGSLFRGLFRTILPVAKSVGKTVGRTALSTGAEIASDVLAGKDLKEAAELRGRAAASNLLDQAVNKLAGKPRRQTRTKTKRRPKQKGRGLGIRGKRKTTTGAATIKRAKKPRGQKSNDIFGTYAPR